ncbi:major pollen allergen Ole e 10-like [Sesamum indicum]|uniref:Major pollen allergen Ole e 10-like n=1 Tax=Sesamum indicum TaxID=4182 RepID=A0A6I9UGM7_SESIN|nr:major pollen allergen Ole e 10-like [Sesamum indicum]
MGKEGGIAAFICLLLCFLCSNGGGAAVFSAEAKLVPLSRLLVNNPGHDHKPNHYVMKSNQKEENGSRTWCIVKPSTSEEKLDDIIQYCCTQPNVDCKVIQAGGTCYRPPNKISDASVVMNIYYHLNGRQDFNCDFKGSGLIVTRDPSVGKCIYRA